MIEAKSPKERGLITGPKLSETGSFSRFMLCSTESESKYVKTVPCVTILATLSRAGMCSLHNLLSCV